MQPRARQIQIALFSFALSFAVSFGGPATAQYALFDEFTDTISVPGNTVFGGTFTLEAQILFDPALPSPSAGGLVFQEQYETEEDKALTVGTEGMGANAWRSVNDWYGFPIPVCMGIFHHVAFVCDGNDERLYLDGRLLSSRVRTGTVTNYGGSPMSIGAFFTLEPEFRPSFRGYLDSVRVSSAALYSGSVFAAPTGNLSATGSTVLLYNFDDPLGSLLVADGSANGWTGSMGVGFPGATAPEIVASAPVTYCSQIIYYCTAKVGACGGPSISSIGTPITPSTSGFVVQAAPVRGAKPGLLLYNNAGPAVLPFSGGILCVAPMGLRRTISVNSGGTPGACDGMFSIDMNAFASGVLGGSPASYLSLPGTRINAQWWGRDTLVTGTILSNAIEYEVQF